MKYLIWSFNHNLWWGPNLYGYTESIELAGRYTSIEAGEIVTKSVFNESIQVIEVNAIENGPPKFHPYEGKHSLS